MADLRARGGGGLAALNSRVRGTHTAHRTARAMHHARRTHQRDRNSCQRGTTRSTCVCCNISSETRIAYGSRVRRHGRSRAWRLYHARSKRPNRRNASSLTRAAGDLDLEFPVTANVRLRFVRAMNFLSRQGAIRSDTERYREESQRRPDGKGMHTRSSAHPLCLLAKEIHQHELPQAHRVGEVRLAARDGRHALYEFH